MTLPSTSPSQIDAVHETLVATFKSGLTLPLDYRRQQLLQFAKMFQENADKLFAALQSDISRHKIELSIVELSPIIGGAIRAAQSLDEWTKPDKPAVEEWRANYDTTVYKAPKGAVVIIGPWNYPYVTGLLPFIGAIAAGCTVVFKPSEFSPAAAQALVDLFPKYLDSKAYTIVTGGIDETRHLLSLKWQHIFFTGSKRVGQIVAEAAAKHITPVTLELGGKSPVFIDAEHTDVERAAKRILWGKQTNAGQICVAPDYVLVPRRSQDVVAKAFIKAYNEFYPNGSIDKKSDLATILNPTHFERLDNLLKKTNGTILTGGGTEGTSRLDVTVLRDVSTTDVLMEDEIFGPILPIVPVNDVDEAIKHINGYPVPLVIYVFTERDAIKEKFLHETQSGTLTLNDTVQQLGIYEMPFGGQGESGYGSYLGKHSFNTFIHSRSYINVPASADQFIGLRYPPYSEDAYKLISAPVFAPIPNA